MKFKVIARGTVSRPNGKFSYNAWPSIICCSDGVMICSWSGNRLRHVCPHGKVVAARSIDGGFTWDEPTVVFDSPLDDRDAGLVEASDGKLFLTTFTNTRSFQLSDLKHRGLTSEEIAFDEATIMQATDEDEERYLGSLMLTSTDGGKSFGDPRKTGVTAPHGICKKQNGDLVYVGRAYPRDGEEEGDGLADGIWARDVSPDGSLGEPRLLVPQLSNDSGAFYCEPYAIDLGEGEMLLGIRTDRPNHKNLFTYQCRSFDGGKTFSSPTETVIDGGPPHYLLHSSGALVVVYARRREPYQNCARVSFDGGRTYSEEFVFDPAAPGWDIGYPCTAENDRGELVTVYYKRDAAEDRFCQIKYVVWTFEK